MSSSSRPGAFGHKITLSTLDDVNAALHELGWLQQTTAVVEAQTKKAVEHLKLNAASKLSVEIDGKAVKFSDRIKSLHSALAGWCATELAKHLPGEAKSLTLPHGRIGTKSVADAVVYTEGEDEKSVLANITQKAGLKTLIAQWLTHALGAITLGVVIRLKPELDKAAIKEAWSSATMRRTLTSLGITVETNRDELVIEPASVEVSTPAT
jgi:hypothetical protein